MKIDGEIYIDDMVIVNGNVDDIYFNKEIGVVVSIYEWGLGIVFPHNNDFKFHSLPSSLSNDEIIAYSKEYFRNFDDRIFLKREFNNKGLWFFRDSKTEIKLLTKPYDPNQQPIDDKDI